MFLLGCLNVQLHYSLLASRRSYRTLTFNLAGIYQNVNSSVILQSCCLPPRLYLPFMQCQHKYLKTYFLCTSCPIFTMSASLICPVFTMSASLICTVFTMSASLLLHTYKHKYILYSSSITSSMVG